MPPPQPLEGYQQDDHEAVDNGMALMELDGKSGFWEYNMSVF
jgi:hypothetical protein